MRLQRGERRAAVAAVDGRGQRTDRAVEAPAAPQRDDPARQRRVRRHAAQVAEHRARLHRRELVAVAQQQQPCPGRQRGEQRVHHLQVHHRRLVDDQQVHVQRIRLVVHEAPRARPRAQQRMQRARRAQALREPIDRRGRLGQRPQLQQGLRDGLAQPRRRLAGGRRQPDAQRASRPAGGRRGERQRLQQRQQANHGRRLAGSRTAGEDTETAARRQCAGHFLPVGPGLAGRCGRKQPVEDRAQRVQWQRGLQRRRQRQPALEGAAHVLFVLPVTAQIQAWTDAYQRRVASTASDQQRMLERHLPLRQAQSSQHLRWQRWRIRRCQRIPPLLALGRQRQGKCRCL
ncbi:MAG: hypothetical protein AW09_004552 [Candidatus Accumulibacter phosphatis]|uniref:Uncharacterized protein n=1 Tax=Candidatus Accumulibacter phosphatis TaxID=327160 RepID=A0A084Y6K8_9PROT|nr:MAG: hypothetical protein AW09_004552 [Candidatus Accumulibacter phosphatis]